MTATLGILALLEAKPGKDDELAAFLKAVPAPGGHCTWSSCEA
jgi:predicted phage gp36 major capsid-like protein